MLSPLKFRVFKNIRGNRNDNGIAIFDIVRIIVPVPANARYFFTQAMYFGIRRITLIS